MQIKLPKIIFNNPISEATLDEVLGLLEIQNTDRIIDIGGGNGAVLAKMITNNTASGTLIEINEQLIAECENLHKDLIHKGQLKTVQSDAKDFLKTLDLESIDCVVSIGSSYALGGFDSFIKTILPYLKKDGMLLLGDQFWNTTPNAEYLKILGAKMNDFKLHHENIESAEGLGLTYLYSQIASESDWNRFEGLFFLEKEVKAEQSTELFRKLENIRAFRRAQFKYGRAMMGFGLYLFKK